MKDLAQNASASARRALVDQLPIAAYVCDGADVIVAANARLDALLGRDSVIGVSEAALWTGLRAPGAETGASAALQARACLGECEHEERIVTSEGVLMLRVAATPIGDDSSAPDLLVCVHPISDRSRLQLERELERSRAELDQFAYAASHDLQEPLRMVNGFLGLLRRHAGASLDERCQGHIATALEGTRRMHAQIMGLLAWSRAGRLPLASGPVDAGAAFDAAVARVRGPADEIGATITRGELPTVIGDQPALVDVFAKLLENAIAYRGSTPLTVEATASRRGNEWVFTVVDNGIGIAPEHHERVFEPLQRLEGRERHDGPGMGLALCRRLIARHGGRMWVESENGAGARFRFTLVV
ncbi:MAG: hypothetical protein H0W72_07415 [Planctomycetes bacterium]|nr:hypothetical protein [Planctomycetota bacterium]